MTILLLANLGIAVRMCYSVCPINEAFMPSQTTSGTRNVLKACGIVSKGRLMDGSYSEDIIIDQLGYGGHLYNREYSI